MVPFIDIKTIYWPHILWHSVITILGRNEAFFWCVCARAVILFLFHPFHLYCIYEFGAMHFSIFDRMEKYFHEFYEINVAFSGT